MAVRIHSKEVDRGRFHHSEKEPSLPGLVFVHDVWGLSDHSQALCRDLASEGFGVLELDLYRDLGVVRPTGNPGAFIRSLSDPEVLAVHDAAADWLAVHSICRGRRVGIAGVCMGGTYALLAACLSDRFSASAPFCGILSYETGMLADPDGRDRAKKPRSPLEVADRLRMPLRASFGIDDEFVPGADVDRLEVALAESGQRFFVDRYEGAGHAFLNRTRKDAYRPHAAAEAWRRVIPFLHGALD